MTRQIRLIVPGALQHITSIGNEGRPLFFHDCDRVRFLDYLGEAAARFKWIVTAYTLMTSEYRFFVELTQPTLSDGLKWLNAKYAQSVNRRLERVGHLFQAPFDAKIVEKKSYGLKVVRDVMLEPVRSGCVRWPEEYEWSSYGATLGLVDGPEWLAIDEILARFGENVNVARERFKRFVERGIGSATSPWDDLVGGMYLGSRSWIERVAVLVDSAPRSTEFPQCERDFARPTMRAIIAAVADVMRIDEHRIRAGRGGIARMVAAWIAWYEGRLRSKEIAAALRMRNSGWVRCVVTRCDDALRTQSVLREIVDRCLATMCRKNCLTQI